MKRTRCFSPAAGLLAALALLSGWAVPGALAQPARPPAVPVFAAADSAAIPGVEFFDEVVYLPVRVNGSGPYPFVLDTGAGQVSALDQQVADGLALKSEFVGLGGGAGEDRAEIRQLEPVAIALEGLSFASRDLVGIPLHRMDPHWGKRKDGLVGGDLLSTVVTVLDYAGRTVVFHDPARFEYAGPGARIPVEVMNDYLFVRARVLPYGDGEPIEAFMILDTGLRVTVFNEPFAREHGLATQSPATVQGITGFGLGGISRGVVGRVRGIGIGEVMLNEPVVSFSTDTSGTLSSDFFSGIIGADVLSRFKVVLDYGRSYIVLADGRLGEPFEYDMSGIRWLFGGEQFERLEVLALFAGSPAAEAGLREGDVVTAIDGRAPGEFTRETLGAWLRREGAAVSFTIARGEQTRQVTVKLRRLV